MPAQLSYKTLREENSAEFIINKSRFIGYGCPCETEEEALAFLARIRQKHKDATHNCYAYIIGLNSGIMRYSDDGEPGGTAGMPIIEVMKARGVVNCAVVVTRYFGGILLGAGGLVRAYSTAARMAVEAAGIVTYTRFDEFRLVCSYANYQRYLAELPKFGAPVDGTDFADRVTLRFAIPAERSAALCRRITEMSNGADVPARTGERFDRG